jgi:hypothetical protein
MPRPPALPLLLLVALCWPQPRPADAAGPRARAGVLRSSAGVSISPAGGGERQASALQAGGQTSGAYDCSAHDALYGQIHADLMRFALRGIREENIRWGRRGRAARCCCQWRLPRRR